MILADSSVWIDYFKKGDHSFVLSDLLNQNIVNTNDLILSELLPFLVHRKEHDIIAGLLSLQQIRINIFWEGIRNLQVLNLKNGLNKIGIPDLIIVQQCLVEDIELWSLDKHFKLMANHTALKLFSGNLN